VGEDDTAVGRIAEELGRAAPVEATLGAAFGFGVLIDFLVAFGSVFAFLLALATPPPIRSASTLISPSFIMMKDIFAATPLAPSSAFLFLLAPLAGTSCPPAFSPFLNAAEYSFFILSSICATYSGTFRAFAETAFVSLTFAAFLSFTLGSP